MKVRFLIWEEGPQDPHWGKSFRCLVLPFFPGTSGSLSVCLPLPPWSDGEWDAACEGTGPLEAVWLSHSRAWWGGRGGRPCQGSIAKPATASAVLSPSSSAVSSRTGMLGQTHRLPDLGELIFLPTPLPGKQMSSPPHPPPFSGPWYLASMWCSLYYITWLKTECFLLRWGKDVRSHHFYWLLYRRF